MLKIRLRRIGTNKKPFYRFVVSDSRKTPRGSFLEIIGHYNPTTDPPEIVINLEKADEWIKKGAHPSETVRSILEKAKLTQ
ncbi:MAG: 30S ribosomal protein S16 [Acidobacteriota bacterium]